MEKTPFNPEQPISNENNEQIDLDKIAELGKSKDNFYYLKIPRKHSNKEFSELNIRRMNIEAVLAKIPESKEHIKEKREHDNKEYLMERENGKILREQLGKLIFKAMDGEFGQGYETKVASQKQGYTQGRIVRQLLPLGLHSANILADKKRGVIYQNQIISFDNYHEMINKLINLGADNLDAKGYFIKIYQTKNENK